MARSIALVMALVAGCASTTDTPLPAPSTTVADVKEHVGDVEEASTTTPPAPTSTTSPRLTAPPVAGAPGAGGAVEQEGMPGQATAKASWYARGARTASGEAFDPDGLTAAHRTLAFGTRLRVCHVDRCVEVRVNDRGPAAWTGRELDLSRAAFAAIAPLGAGVVEVTWEAA